MADTPASPGPAEKSGTFGFLTKKLGPAPVWLWGALAVGVYYWYTHYGPGAKTTAAASAAKGAGGVTAGPRGKTGPAGPPGPRGPAGSHGPQAGNGRKRGGGGTGGPTRQRGAAVASAAAPPPQPVYDAYVADASGVPEPMAAYAPMTAGAIYA